MTFVSAWGSFLTSTLIADAVVAVVALVAVRALHRTPAAFRHALLLVAVVKFALPPLPGPSLPRLLAFRIEGMSATVFATLMLVPLAGTVFALTMLIAQSIRIRRIVNAGSVCEDHFGYLHDLAAQMGSPVPRLVTSASAPVPFVTGLSAPVVVLPEYVLDRQPGEQRLVIAHELAHLALGDPALNRLDAILGAIFWWNPLFRCVRRELRSAREERCDDLVLARTGATSHDYSIALVEIASAMRGAIPGVAAMSSESARSLELRLRNIAARGARTGKLSSGQRLAIAVVALCLLPLSIAGTEGAPRHQHRYHVHAHGH